MSMAVYTSVQNLMDQLAVSPTATPGSIPPIFYGKYLYGEEGMTPVESEISGMKVVAVAWVRVVARYTSQLHEDGTPLSVNGGIAITVVPIPRRGNESHEEAVSSFYERLSRAVAMARTDNNIPLCYPVAVTIEMMPSASLLAQHSMMATVGNFQVIDEGDGPLMVLRHASETRFSDWTDESGALHMPPVLNPLLVSGRDD